MRVNLAKLGDVGLKVRVFERVMFGESDIRVGVIAKQHHTGLWSACTCPSEARFKIGMTSGCATR